MSEEQFESRVQAAVEAARKQCQVCPCPLVRAWPFPRPFLTGRSPQAEMREELARRVRHAEERARARMEGEVRRTGGVPDGHAAGSAHATHTHACTLRSFRCPDSATTPSDWRRALGPPGCASSRWSGTSCGRTWSGGAHTRTRTTRPCPPCCSRLRRWQRAPQSDGLSVRCAVLPVHVLTASVRARATSAWLRRAPRCSGRC